MRALPLVLITSLSLVACTPPQVKLPAEYPLSGTLSGNWGSSPKLRLALVGTGLPVVVTVKSTIGQNIVPGMTANTWNFGFDLPTPPAGVNVFGVYQVVAFDDANNDAQISLGETIARNRLLLVYSLSSATIGPVTMPTNLPEFVPWQGEELLPKMTVASGWNLFDRNQPLSSTNPHPVTNVTGYDISR